MNQRPPGYRFAPPFYRTRAQRSGSCAERTGSGGSELLSLPRKRDGPKLVRTKLRSPVSYPGNRPAISLIQKRKETHKASLSLLPCAPKKDIRHICRFPLAFNEKTRIFSCSSAFFEFAQKRYQMTSLFLLRSRIWLSVKTDCPPRKRAFAKLILVTNPQ